MPKNVTKKQDAATGYQAEIERLNKEIESLRGESKVAMLEAEIEDLKQQKQNSQISSQQSMTNLPGYDEEFERLKEDEIKFIRESKRKKIISTFTSIIVIPVSAYIVYLISVYLGFTTGVDKESAGIYPMIIAVVFAGIEISAVFTLIKTIFLNPEKIPEQTLSYLSLTAKEHVLDPKGSVIREKYGTGKWTSVTRT